MFQVVRYYSYGIFRGESHPVPKRKEAKHNPLQRLVYLSLAAFLLPLQMALGVSLLGIQLVESLGSWTGFRWTPWRSFIRPVPSPSCVSSLSTSI
jgi:thiosulfate reductase cytochrome b subunit